MLVSTSRISQLKISEEVMLPQTLRMTLQKILLVSLLKLLYWITPVKSKRDMHQSSIATLHILLANSMKLNLKLIEELVKLLKLNLRILNLVMLLWLEWFPKNLCALKLSINILLLEDLPSEIWNKLLPSELLRKSQRKNSTLKLEVDPKPERKESENVMFA